MRAKSGTIQGTLRFFFCETLRRAYPIEEMPYPNAPRSLPAILTQDARQADDGLLDPLALSRDVSTEDEGFNNARIVMLIHIRRARAASTKTCR